jgi:periplasmic copper chaperone A
MTPILFTTKNIAACAVLAWTTGLFSLQTAAQTVPQVRISKAWIRATVPGQQGTGGFMTLTAQQPLRLVALSSPAAGTAELHEMRMEGDVMHMRALADGIALPAGQALELKPGGMHIMLTQIQQTLKVGSLVPLTLRFVDAKGQRSSMTLQIPVALRVPEAANTKPEAQPAMGKP